MKNKLECFRMLISILTAYWIFHECDGRIIRDGDEFLGQFTLVESDQRIKHNCIRNITKNTTLQECCKECLKEKKCQSFNRHREKGFCELLAISKFNETGLLQKDENWVHYETDDDEKNVGRVCTYLSPCQPYQICEDTLKPDPAFQCRCRDGFEGKKCQDYKGPGTEISNPAASCELLLMKFKNIPDGEYWFEGESKKKRCERKVDGGLTPWSLFGPCNFTKGKCGTQERNRFCTNPLPKGGGRSCDHLGHQEESKPCTNCTDKCIYNLINSTAFKLEHKSFGIFKRILTEYRVTLDLKFNAIQMDSHHKIFTNSNREKNNNGYRPPNLWMVTSSSETFLRVYGDFPLGYHDIRLNENQFEDTTVDISQRKMLNGSYVFTIICNGNSKFSIEIEMVDEYENMEFLLVDLNPSLHGSVRNLYLEGFCDLKHKPWPAIAGHGTNKQTSNGEEEVAST